MLNRNLYFPGLIWICSVSVASAQEPWTLQQCIDYALEHNIQVKQSGLNVEQSRFQKQQSAAGMFPSLNGNASQNYYFGRSIDPNTNIYTNQQVQSNSFGLSSTLPIFEGLQLQNTLRQSQLDFMSSQYDLRKVKNDISLNVATAYLQVLYNQELLKVAEDQLEASRLQKEKIQRMFDLGASSRGDLLDMESQLASDELKLVQAKSALDQGTLTLTQLLELDSTGNFTIVKPALPVPQLEAAQTDVNGVYASALTNQPDIKSSEYKLLSAEKGVSIAQGARLPRLFVSGSLNTTYSTSDKVITDYIYGPPSTEMSGYTSSGDTVYSIVPNVTPVLGKRSFSSQLDNNFGKSIGFTLQIPVFNGWSTRIGIRRAKINLEQTRLNHEQTQKNLYKSVQQAVSDAIAAFRSYEAGKKSAEAQRQAFEFNQQRYDSGLISSYDYLTSKNNHAKAEADLLQAQYEFIFRIKILDFYQGKPLVF